MKKDDSRVDPYSNKDNNTRYNNHNRFNDDIYNKSRENSDHDDHYKPKDHNRPPTPDRYSKESYLEWIGY